MTDQQLTPGQKLCGVSFNPGQRKDVADIKQTFAVMVDFIGSLAERDPDDYEFNMVAHAALQSLMSAQMWAVKAATWFPEQPAIDHRQLQLPLN